VDIKLSTKDANFLGTGNLVFVSETGEEQRVENVDLLGTYFRIHDQLNEDEQKGTKFLIWVRRYILTQFGVAVSVLAAQKFYETIQKIVESAENFSTTKPDSSDSTGSPPTPSPQVKDESSLDSSTDSPPKNTES
jgi:hypothetical protein